MIDEKGKNEQHSTKQYGATGGQEDEQPDPLPLPGLVSFNTSDRSHNASPGTVESNASNGNVHSSGTQAPTTYESNRQASQPPQLREGRMDSTSNYTSSSSGVTTDRAVQPEQGNGRTSRRSTATTRRRHSLDPAVRLTLRHHRRLSYNGNWSASRTLLAGAEQLPWRSPRGGAALSPHYRCSMSQQHRCERFQRRSPFCPRRRTLREQQRISRTLDQILMEALELHGATFDSWKHRSSPDKNGDGSAQ